MGQARSLGVEEYDQEYATTYEGRNQGQRRIYTVVNNTTSLALQELLTYISIH